jgi:hypothetical protein
MKEHSFFRAFSLFKETNMDSVSLFYKNSSLDLHWIGLERNNLNGILLFNSFPEVKDSSKQIQPLHLNSIMINKLLYTGTVTEHLNIESKKYYLQL